MVDYSKLDNYQPEKITDGKAVIRSQKNKANVIKALSEMYEGSFEDYKGCTFYRLEFQFCDGEVYKDKKTGKEVQLAGRTVKKNFNLDKEGELEKVQNWLFTVGLEFKDAASLTVASEALVKKTVLVSSYGFTPEDKDEPVQVVKMVGEAKEAGTVSQSTPY